MDSASSRAIPAPCHTTGPARAGPCPGLAQAWQKPAQQRWKKQRGKASGREFQWTKSAAQDFSPGISLPKSKAGLADPRWQQAPRARAASQGGI